MLISTIIASGQTKSRVVTVCGYTVMGIILPSLNSCNISFEVGHTPEGQFVSLIDNDGALDPVPAGEGGCAISSELIAPLAGYPYFKIVSSVQQTADRNIKIMLKR